MQQLWWAVEKTSTKSGTSAALVVLKCSLLVEEDIKSAMIIEHATKIGIIMNKVAISLFSSVSDFVRVSEANLEILRFLDYTIAVVRTYYYSNILEHNIIYFSCNTASAS